MSSTLSYKVNSKQLTVDSRQSDRRRVLARPVNCLLFTVCCLLFTTYGQRVIASAISLACSNWWMAYEPVAGLAEAARPM